ncbi:MAG: c-type cytochrome, partial [Planctomycetales bacterium]|nr:c-type cytochrome [Planctomycetales bacterium]
DMYRYMIEHPQWLPQNGKNELRPWYRTGQDRGRIYRVVRKDQPAREVPRLTDLSTTQLVVALESPNGWQRDMVQRILVRKKPGGAIEMLDDLALHSKHPLARLHALWTLVGLNALSTQTLQTALADDHPGVRRNALRMATDIRVDVEPLTLLVTDPDAKVRLELASTLGSYDDAAAGDALAQLALSSVDDCYIAAGVLSSLNPNNISSVVRKAVQSSNATNVAIVLELIGQTVAMGDSETISDLIEIVAADPRPELQRLAFLAKIHDGLDHRKWKLDQLSDNAGKVIADTVRQARHTTADDRVPEDVRAGAIALLARQEGGRVADFELMQTLLGPQSSVAVQQAIVARLAQLDLPVVANVMLKDWQTHSPGLRTQILDVLSSRATWADALLIGLEDGTIAANDLDASMRKRLLDRHERSARWQKTLGTRTTASRARVLSDYQDALQLSGDKVRGRAVFQKRCINCHKLGNEGHQVGPDLASITNKTKEALLTAVLDPNAAVDAKYLNYTVVTIDGRVLSGTLEAETGSSVTLLAAEEKRYTVLRRDIEQLRASNQSLMPEGLEEGSTPQDVADLIEFVRQTFR